jgi:hypothetical protein
LGCLCCDRVVERCFCKIGLIMMIVMK